MQGGCDTPFGDTHTLATLRVCRAAAHPLWGVAAPPACIQGVWKRRKILSKISYTSLVPRFQFPSDPSFCNTTKFTISRRALGAEEIAQRDTQRKYP